MTAIVLALLSAISYGLSDFLAGLASRRGSFLRVAVVAQVTSVAVVAGAVPLAGGHPTARALLWGALSGVGGGIGSIALYRGLARGQMSVAGPISGVGAAVIPVVGGLALDRTPSTVTLIGVVVAVPAVWLIAREPGHGGTTRGGIVDGLVAGVGFGVLFLALSRAGPGAGLWPSAASGVLSAAIIVSLALVWRPAPEKRGAARSTWVGSVLAGVTGGAAIGLYLVATRHGLLVVVGVLAALYPAVTVLLARLILRERSGRTQLLGLAMAAGAVVAIVAG